jgi:hypothetical protein
MQMAGAAHLIGRPAPGDERVSDPAGRDDRIRHRMRSELTCAWATKEQPARIGAHDRNAPRTQSPGAGRSGRVQTAALHFSRMAEATDGRDRLARREFMLVPVARGPGAAVVTCRSQPKRATSMATAGQQPGHRCDAIGRAAPLGSVPVLISRPVRTARSSIL